MNVLYGHDHHFDNLRDDLLGVAREASPLRAMHVGLQRSVSPHLHLSQPSVHGTMFQMNIIVGNFVSRLCDVQPRTMQPLFQWLWFTRRMTGRELHEMLAIVRDCPRSIRRQKGVSWEAGRECNNNIIWAHFRQTFSKYSKHGEILWLGTHFRP